MTSAKPQSGARFIRPFSEQPTFGKVFAAVLAPALFGSLAVITAVVGTILGVLGGWRSRAR